MSVLIKPLVTEKMTSFAEEGVAQKQYGFLVNRNASKPQIKEAVEGLYDVTVTSVRTANYKPRRKRQYTKTSVIEGWKAARKKAFVTLADGQEIDFYKNIQ